MEVDGRDVIVENDVEGTGIGFAVCDLLLIIADNGLLVLLFTLVIGGFNVSFGSKKQALSVTESFRTVLFGRWCSFGASKLGVASFEFSSPPKPVAAAKADAAELDDSSELIIEIPIKLKNSGTEGLLFSFSTLNLLMNFVELGESVVFLFLFLKKSQKINTKPNYGKFFVFCCCLDDFMCFAWYSNVYSSVIWV